jgi:hypothetical protein
MTGVTFKFMEMMKCKFLPPEDSGSGLYQILFLDPTRWRFCFDRFSSPGLTVETISPIKGQQIRWN